jgi:hypothetical protein
VSFLDRLVCHFDHAALEIKVLRLNIYLAVHFFRKGRESGKGYVNARRRGGEKKT